MRTQMIVHCCIDLDTDISGYLAAGNYNTVCPNPPLFIAMLAFLWRIWYIQKRSIPLFSPHFNELDVLIFMGCEVWKV